MQDEERNFGIEKCRMETAGINAKMPLHYRFLMWQLIDYLADSIENVRLDYLQVFAYGYRKEKDDSITQIVTHSQEQPPYKATYEFPHAEKGIQGKVFCIDDGACCTMLWADEY